ncbi:MAG: beta-glucosidase [Phenylobacterium sp.]|nr:MAG: beta-glucosidase [Phenylobacterium sp.]
MRRVLLAGAAAIGLALAGGAAAAPASQPWMNPRLTPDQRADLVLKQMSLDEQIGLLHGSMPMFLNPRPPGVVISAGYIAGLPRLGVPPLKESDASLGVANAGRGKTDDATALPSGLATAATWDPKIAYQGGAMIGKQARQKGFNVLLAGGVNLIRDPRNGRNFEYGAEDPLLAGTMAGAAIRGIQSNHIISTTKHYAVNDQETGRMVLDAQLGDAAARESDLLAFEIAIETGHPGSVMCAYQRVNGTYACENPYLLTDVLKRDWAWPGFVMSDWGAVHSLGAAKAGLDQESGQQLDKQVYFDKPLKAAVASGEISAGKVHDMAHRVLRAMFAQGLFEHPPEAGGLDTAADAAVALKAAEQGIVLLKNEGGLLPLARHARKIAVIGGHADVGVISGGGSSQVAPLGSVSFPRPPGAPKWGGGILFHPSSPLKALQARAGGAEVVYDDGSDPARAAALAKSADVAIVFATQWASEAMDVSLTLTDNQDALIDAVASAQPKTVVVLETGNPVLTPWIDKVGALVEAWYPGHKGGEAIAEVLTGEVNPSGRLPVSFPASEAQLPRPALSGDKVTEAADNSAQPKPFDVAYTEGSDVGYRWFAKTGEKPAFAFGRGLSYTRFRYSDAKVTGGKTLTVSFRVTNTGARAGTETPQLYLAASPGRRQQRLIGWSRVALKPGASTAVTLAAAPRMLANWDEHAHAWRVAGGAYRVFVGPDAATPALRGSATVSATSLKP